MGNRKLDALFAEKVLGIEAVQSTKGLGGHDYRQLTAYSGVAVMQLIPEYTQSLDAAWTGVEKLDGSFYFQVRGACNHCFTSSVKWSDHGHDGKLWNEVYDDPPAMALSKACLLAVGVTQEEIDACREGDYAVR